MINIDIFKTEWKKIQTKLDEITSMSWDDIGEDFDGIEISDGSINYRTSTYFSGCGTNTFSFYISLEELNQPKEYWEQRRQKEIQDKIGRKIADEEKAKKYEKEKELKLLKELQEKYK